VDLMEIFGTNIHNASCQFLLNQVVLGEK